MNKNSQTSFHEGFWEADQLFGAYVCTNRAFIHKICVLVSQVSKVIERMHTAAEETDIGFRI